MKKIPKSVALILLISYQLAHSEVVSRGEGYASRCKDATYLAIQNAAQNAQGRMPTRITSFTDIRNNALMNEEILTKKDYYLISYTSDSSVTHFGCKVLITAKFDSSKLQSLVMKFKGWEDSGGTDIWNPPGSGKISSEFLKRRKEMAYEYYVFLARYVQMAFRNAFDVEISRKYETVGMDQRERSILSVKSNSNYAGFIDDIQTMLNDMQDKFDFSPQVNIYFSFGESSDYNYGELKIYSTRYLDNGIPLLQKAATITKPFQYSAKVERILYGDDDYNNPDYDIGRFSYYVQVKSEWDCCQMHQVVDVSENLMSRMYNCSYGNPDNPGQFDSNSIACLRYKWAEKKTPPTPPFGAITLSIHGIDYDLSRMRDTVCSPTASDLSSCDLYRVKFSLSTQDPPKSKQMQANTQAYLDGLVPISVIRGKLNKLKRRKR